MPTKKVVLSEEDIETIDWAKDAINGFLKCNDIDMVEAIIISLPKPISPNVFLQETDYFLFDYFLEKNDIDNVNFLMEKIGSAYQHLMINHDPDYKAIAAFIEKNIRKDQDDEALKLIEKFMDADGSGEISRKIAAILKQQREDADSSSDSFAKEVEKLQDPLSKLTIGQLADNKLKEMDASEEFVRLNL